MPTPFLSLAAAAAAAEAYLRVEVVGNGAGFMLVSFGTGTGGGGCMIFSEAKAGRGDLSCVDGRRTATGGSDLVFLMGAGPVSASGESSCNDWAS